MVLLLSLVHVDHTLGITTYDNAAEAWKYLSDRYDRDTGNTAIHLFRKITSLRYQEGEDLRDYLDDFHQL